MSFEIAVYGKGGIGKSTICANLSAALGMSGRRVMQIGCDPKHDSTRQLMHGEKIPAVLDYLREKGKEAGSIDDVLRTGVYGIGCIEAGGPRPGVGCAGRGIISAFEFLDQHKIKQNYDTVVYDVLGDVVCGGFAVPVRREYADAVFLVTSGEFMAIYAANNILKGIQNFDGDKYSRVAGIIYNERKLRDEDERIERFAKAVGLPVLTKVPRSDAFADAEKAGRTVMEMEGCEEEKAALRSVAERISADMQLYPARPLTDEKLEELILGITPTGAPEHENVKEDAKAGASGEAVWREYCHRQPLYGCAFNGAASTAVHVNDAIVIAHSPTACAFYTWQNISSPGRRALFTRGILMPSALSPNFECTDMGHSEAVFGGMEKLREAVADAISRRPGAVIVVSSCVSGIIGDDIMDIENMSTEDVPVIAVPADGDMAGDYVEGIRMCTYAVASRLIRPGTGSRRRLNILGEMAVSSGLDENIAVVKRWMDMMDVEIGCRFPGDASAAGISGLLDADLSVMAYSDADCAKLRSWLEERYDIDILDEALPVGWSESEKWVTKVAEHFGCSDTARSIIDSERQEYERSMASLKGKLRGKKLFILTVNRNMDWFIEPAIEAGMDIRYIGVMNYMRNPLCVTEIPELQSVVDETLESGRLIQRIEQDPPDIIVGSYESLSPDGDYIKDAIPMVAHIGFQSGIRVLERWAYLFERNRKGKWKRDEELFRKYFS